MSTQRKPDFVEETPSETSVVDYLAANPEFFERHASLLSTLRLPHAAGGAVSLVERQVSMLRQKELKLERQLKELIAVARTNDTLAAKVHALSIQLLAARELGTTIAAIEEAMRSGFGADHAVLVLFGDSEAFDDIDAGRFFRVVDRNDESLGPFDTFLKGSSARCGQVRDTQREFLFRQDAGDVGSVALVPLGKKSSVGFLGIGSIAADRFHPGMSTDFLTRVGALVTEALKRF